MKSGRFFVLFLCSVIIFSSVVYGQRHNVDSLKKVLQNEKEDTNKVNTLNYYSNTISSIGYYDTGDSLAKKALELSQKLNFQKGLSKSYRSLGSANYQARRDSLSMKYYVLALKNDEAMQNKWGIGHDYASIGLVYTHLGDYDEALKYCLKGLEMQEASNNKSSIYRTYQFIGILYKKKGNYPEALKNYLLSLKTAEEAGDKEVMAADYMNIGNIYIEQSNDTEALKNYFISLKINEGLGDIKSLGNAYGNIGNIYYNRHNYSEALNYYSKSLKIAEQTEDKDGMTNAYANIGNIYEAQNNPEEAFKYQTKSLEIDKEVGNREGIAEDYINLAGILIKQKKYGEAKQTTNKAVEIAKELGGLQLLQTSYEALASLDTAMNNYNAAYLDYMTFIRYRDSLNNQANTKKIVSEQMNYEFEKKQAAEKAEQDKKDAIASAEKRKQGIITTSVSLGLLLVLIFSVLLFSRFRLTQKQKLIIENQKVTVEHKNKEVLDSITYAKRLQDAILPPISIIKKVFPESFVLYKPKDIVAGDFYWMERVSPLLKGEVPIAIGKGEVILIAAADCTGHGVPGALVSVVCSNALNRAVKEFKITEPGSILDKVRELVLETFSHAKGIHEEKSESNVKDGMDISLCLINTRTKDIKWSGAYNPLWIVSASEGESSKVVEISPDKQPIGEQDNAKPFSTHSLNLKKGDIIYLFTDGYADQFGGPEGKKFKYRQLQEKLLSMATLGMDKQKEMLEETLENWKGKLEQVDDILIIGLRV